MKKLCVGMMRNGRKVWVFGFQHELRREYEYTELGLELRCARCGEYWPEDFFNVKGPYRHSYCKACCTERKAELRKTRRLEAQRCA